MTKVWRVGRTEYLNIVRTKAFILSVVLLPVFMFGAIILMKVLEDRVDIAERRFAVVDRTGRLYAKVEQAAAVRNETRIHKDGRQVRPRFVPEAVEADDADALSDRVRRGELFAYVIVGDGVIAGEGAIAYHSQSPTYTDLAKWLRETLNNEIQRIRFAEAEIDEATMRTLTTPVRVGQFGLVQKTATGEVSKAKRVNKASTFGIPAAAMFLVFMLVMVAAPHLLNNTLEEKMQKIAEVLVSSVSPFELFLGKLIGIVLVSWTLTILYLGGIVYLAHRFEFASEIRPSLYAWFLFFQLLALFMYGSIFSAFGAAASEIRDTQSMMLPAMLVLMIPMFVWLPVLKNPTSDFAVAMSLVPPATPFLMLMRIAIPPGPAVWEIALGIVLCVAFTLACVWAASKIFRIGILAQGQTPSFRKMISWVFSK